MNLNSAELRSENLKSELLNLLGPATQQVAEMKADPNYCKYCNRVHSHTMAENLNSGMFEITETCEGDRR